jgi:hypothetical protein
MRDHSALQFHDETEPDRIVGVVREARCCVTVSEIENGKIACKIIPSILFRMNRKAVCSTAYPVSCSADLEAGMTGIVTGAAARGLCHTSRNCIDLRLRCAST